MDSMADARPFPFFKLPAELRNIIYGLVVITGRSLIVEDMHPNEFAKSQEDGTYQTRSTYLAKDHTCNRNRWSCGLNKFEYIDSQPIRTTYKIGNPDYIYTTTAAMLSLNKQSRDEVAFLVYGGNTFHFITMSSLLPFMKDRTVETRKYIQRLRLTLTIDYRTWNAVCTEQGRSAAWNAAFSALVKLPHVNIKTLCVTVDDRIGAISERGLEIRARPMLWLRNLCKFENLDKLGVRHDDKYVGRHGVNTWTLLEWLVNDWRQSSPQEEETNSQIEQELWQILAPKMLKRKADDHSPDALLDRRIWDFSKWQ